MNIVDEYTRECPVIVVDRQVDADRVVTTLDAIAARRGYPAFVRFEDWRNDYDHRHHSAHRDLTPTEFAQAWTTRHQPALP